MPRWFFSQAGAHPKKTFFRASRQMFPTLCRGMTFVVEAT
jgi:hypothetical protein